MSKEVLKKLSDDTVAFYCKGCKSIHCVSTKLWQFNNDYEKPTFNPSVLVTGPNMPRCHSFITDGKIQYLNDCTHELVGKIIELEEYHE